MKDKEMQGVRNQRVREALEHLSISQTELANRVGLTRSAVNRIILNKNGVSSSTLRRIGDALEIRLEWLLYGEGEMLVRGNTHLPSREDVERENTALKEKLKLYDDMLETYKKINAVLERDYDKRLALQAHREEGTGIKRVINGAKRERSSRTSSRTSQ
jgi:transcriptional regulator with XRE-family HTH domain